RPPATQPSPRSPHDPLPISDTRESLATALDLVVAGKSAPHVKQAQVKGMARPKVAMLFTGQGSQYPQMGRQVYDTEPVFRQVIRSEAHTSELQSRETLLFRL